jgi:8-oxo-dGTP diphosphatase
MDEIRHFCYECGSRLLWQEIEGRPRESCPNCGWVYYRQLKVSAAALIIQNDQLLLLRRAQSPFAGTWYLPAGYVEADEDPALAAVRETFEETGLRVVNRQLLEAILFTDDPRGNGLLLVYACDLVGEGPALPANQNREISEAGFFKREALPPNLCGAGHAQAILRWVKHSYPATDA